MIDRLIQQAILQVLTPIFDPGFSESSFGFRPGRSAHEAAKQVNPTSVPVIVNASTWTCRNFSTASNMTC